MRSAVAGIVALGVLAVASPAAADLPPLAAWSASPVALDEGALTPLERSALARCGRGEAGLRDTAQALLARKLQEGSLPELDGVARAQRAAGEPHPWARGWAARGRALEGLTTMARLDAWLAPSVASRRRCGVASAVSADGLTTLVVVAVDALADLSPLPTRARTGQWLTVEARLRVPAARASVVVLEPGGGTRTVASWLEGSTLRARLAPSGPGELALQVLADVGGGPRPVLEATVCVDIDPPVTAGDQAAPGELAGVSEPDDDALARMVTAARATVGLPALARDARLDALAHAHAERMARAHELAHDAGDGDPAGRMRDAGIDAAHIGENVAHAPTPALAGRALWTSPSHRMNLLARDFDRMGVGVARDAQGGAWVAEAFAGGGTQAR